jgi:hypothetical protein
MEKIRKERGDVINSISLVKDLLNDMKSDKD